MAAASPCQNTIVLRHQIQERIVRLVPCGVVFDESADRVEAIQRFYSVSQPGLIPFQHSFPVDRVTRIVIGLDNHPQITTHVW